MSLSVLLTTEGTYPHYSGGVSSWCDQMVRHATDLDFHILSIVASPHKALSFELPSNVRRVDTLALWGSEEPGRLAISFSEVYERRILTTPERITALFLPSLSVVVRSVLAGLSSDPDALGRAFHEMRIYFNTHDYATTLKSPETWECFKSCLGKASGLSLEDATVCMRWLVRYLAITAYPIPQTDIVHASMAGLAAVPGVLAKLSNGTPFLLSEHGIYLRELYTSLSRMEASEPSRRFLLGWNQAIVRMNYHFADHVTCLGEFNRKWQVVFGADPSKTEIVPNGVDARRFYPDPQSRPKTLTVLTLARIFPLKGIHTLIRAAAIVAAQLPDIRFRILGEVADEVYFAGCVRVVRELRLESVVEFGITDEPEEELRSATLYCLPSVSEGLPYTILEAMFSGCPVVATDVGNVTETMADTGLIVPPGSPDDLANALLALLAGPGAAQLRESLAAAALERARRLYTVEKSMGPIRSRYEAIHQCHKTCQIA